MATFVAHTGRCLRDIDRLQWVAKCLEEKGNIRPEVEVHTEGAAVSYSALR